MGKSAAKLPPPESGLSIDQFLAFTRSRPDEERWELIEGVPVMNASPVRIHQLISGNIVSVLLHEKQRLGAAWLPMLGVGTMVPASPNSLLVSDVYVQGGGLADFSSKTDDALVIFEVLSRSNSKADREWRKRVYASVPNCRHYVTIATNAVRVTVNDRDTTWAERTIAGLIEALDLPALGVSPRLADIYRWTPLAAVS